MLQRNHVYIVEIQVIRRTTIRIEIVFEIFEAHLRRIFISLGDIVYRHDKVLYPGILRGHRLTQVMRKRGNAAFARQIVAQKRDSVDFGDVAHSSSYRYVE